MASMKLSKPSYGYGASQGNFSEYEQQEYQMKQSRSSHAEQKWAGKPNQCSSYYGQGQRSHLGRSMYSFDEDELGHSWANNSTRYHAQAQQVRPCPSIHIQQGNHAMETMKRQESHMGQEWAKNTNMCSSPVRSNYSGGVNMYNEAHRVGKKMEHGWADKSTQCSSPVRANQYGQSMFKEGKEKSYNYSKGSVDGGWAGKPTNFSGVNQFNHSAQSMYKQQEQHDWVDKPNKYSSPARVNHSSLAMHKDEHKMGEMDHGWVSSPTRANHSSLPTQEVEHMMENMSHSSVSSPTRADSSSIAMHNDEHMMGKMDNGFTLKPTQCSSPVRANQYGQSMYKGQEEKVYDFNDRDIGSSWASKSGPNQFNNSGHGMYKEQRHHEWAGKSGNSMGPAKVSHSAHAAYSHHEYEDEDVHDIMDEILSKYPAHNVSSGNESWAAKSAQNQASYGKQGALAGSAHHGSAQSMVWGENREKKGGYIGNCNKEEYSSSANKFEMKSHVTKGGIYGHATGSDSECDD